MLSEARMNPALHTHAAHALTPGLADVALIDAKTCAAVGSMSVSWWHAEVASGRAPAPVIREPRCTRWTLASVRAYWAERAELGTDTPAAGKVIAKAKKASAAAQVKRRKLAGVSTQAGA
jgi:predicted DNA-binding transcriptional regulator AlpA